MESSVSTALSMIIMIGEISIVSNINYGWAKLPLVTYNDNIIVMLRKMYMSVNSIENI